MAFSVGVVALGGREGWHSAEGATRTCCHDRATLPSMLMMTGSKSVLFLLVAIIVIFLLTFEMHPCSLTPCSTGSTGGQEVLGTDL